MERKLFLWMAQNSGANVIEASISNYSSTLTQNLHTFSGVRNKFQLMTEDGMFYSEQFHRVMLQEKLNGAYVV